MKMGYFYVSMLLCFIVLVSQITSRVNAQGPLGYYKAVNAAQSSPAPDNSKANKDQAPNADQADMRGSRRYEENSGFHRCEQIPVRVRAQREGHQPGRQGNLRGPVHSDDEKATSPPKLPQ
jgi:hypothetical protein